VDILEHGNRELRAHQLAKECGEKLLARSCGRDELCEFATQLTGDVEERTERSGSKQSIASPPEDPCAWALQLTEPSNHGALADPGLAADQHEAPLAGGRHGCVTGQRLQNRPAFQKVHGMDARRSGASTADPDRLHEREDSVALMRRSRPP
jgi:hypothetical protein